jgi:hypothetical protein
MGLLIDVGGEFVNGSIFLNYKTKRADMEHSIATVSQKVTLDKVPIKDVEKEIGKSLAILIQKPIRDGNDKDVAIKLARQNPIDWKEIVGVKHVTVRKMTMPEMIAYLKDHPEERDALIEELED